jgi:hypothetical protein
LRGKREHTAFSSTSTAVASKDILLIDLIVSVLRDANSELVQSQIDSAVLKHPALAQCHEAMRVKNLSSAIARSLSKHTSGSSPIISILDEGKDKVSFKRYYLASASASMQNFSVPEILLHPVLTKFAHAMWRVQCKTIQSNKTSRSRPTIGKWTNPDIVGAYPVFGELNELLQGEVKKGGIFSTRVMRFYSFEIKTKIDKSNVTECYFQALSNSAWANYGYVAAGDIDTDRSFRDTLDRLHNAYGIGIIHLNYDQPLESRVLIPARMKESVDVNFMNFLSSNNTDFASFLRVMIGMLNSVTPPERFFDPM